MDVAMAYFGRTVARLPLTSDSKEVGQVGRY
jgi:hypothetical protein